MGPVSYFKRLGLGVAQKLGTFEHCKKHFTLAFDVYKFTPGFFWLNLSAADFPQKLLCSIGIFCQNLVVRHLPDKDTNFFGEIRLIINIPEDTDNVTAEIVSRPQVTFQGLHASCDLQHCCFLLWGITPIKFRRSSSVILLYNIM